MNASHALACGAGTTITILSAARKQAAAQKEHGLHQPEQQQQPGQALGGLVYISSGLGGMSGAQPKAAKIVGCVGVIAEVDGVALRKRHAQGWLDEIVDDVDACIARIRAARSAKESVSIGFHGNVVTLWEALAATPDALVDLGSDQTSLHNPYLGGYYPVQLSFDEGRKMMREDPPQFEQLVQASLRRHVTAVNTLAARGMRLYAAPQALSPPGCRHRASDSPTSSILMSAAGTMATHSWSRHTAQGPTCSPMAASWRQRMAAPSATNRTCIDSSLPHPPFTPLPRAPLTHWRHVAGTCKISWATSSRCMPFGFSTPALVAWRLQRTTRDRLSLVRGFGPFRWVCASGDEADLRETDAIAARVMEELMRRVRSLLCFALLFQA